MHQSQQNGSSEFVHDMTRVLTAAHLMGLLYTLMVTILFCLSHMDTRKWFTIIATTQHEHQSKGSANRLREARHLTEETCEKFKIYKQTVMYSGLLLS